MANQLSRVFDPKYDAHGRWWIMGLLFAAAGTASLVIGILCLTPGKPHIPTTGGPFYGLGIFLLLVGVFLLFVSMNDMLKVPWRRIFPATFFDHCFDFERIMFPNLPKSDASIMACILVMVLVAVALLVVGIILSISVKPFSHVKDLWVGIVFIVVAFMLSLWVALMCTVIHRPFAEAPGGDTSPAGPYAVQRAGPYSEPGGAPNEAPAGPDNA